MSAGHSLIQSHCSVKLPLIQLPHVNIIELLKVRGDQQTVVWNTHSHQAGTAVRNKNVLSSTLWQSSSENRSPSMNCLCCWMISSHRCLCCAKRCTTKFFWRMTLSLSSACDCISAFSISSSWTLQRRPSTSRCSSELTRRGSSSSKRRAWSWSSRNLRSNNVLIQKDKIRDFSERTWFVFCVLQDQG